MQNQTQRKNRTKNQMKNQKQETHGKTTKYMNDEEQIQTDNKEILRHKSGTATSSPDRN